MSACMCVIDYVNVTCVCVMYYVNVTFLLLLRSHLLAYRQTCKLKTVCLRKTQTYEKNKKR
jgi:hypothetical protein